MDTSHTRLALCCLLMSLSLGAAGESVDPAGREPVRDVGRPAIELQRLADFYAPYAAMAAQVYSTKGRMEDSLSSAASSSWLQREMADTVDPELRKSLLDRVIDGEQRAKLYRGRIGRMCDLESLDFTLGANDSAVRAAEGRCRRSIDLQSDDDPDDQPPVDVSPPAVLKEDAPTKWQQCVYHGGDRQPPVPLHRMAGEWATVPELQRTLHPRGWSVFVPGLAIDVWRRKRAATGEAPVVEYALVFRGTADGGGWVSNFRALTAFTPLIWDQYRQARIATVTLVNQIYQLHALSDALFERGDATRIRITAVGHSLGGGLASYVFLRVPQITRVVSFDPSPINGASMFSPSPVSPFEYKKGKRDRASVMADRLQAFDRDDFDPTANIFVLYEDGEILTRLSGCAPGPLWGAEGGPVVRCDGPDLSGGSVIRQHNMPQLACKLYLVSQGLRTGPD